MKCIVAGDLCPRDRIRSKIEKNCEEIIAPKLADAIRSADYAIVNFECPIVEGDARPIAKCGPNLKTDRKAIDLLRNCGFTGVTLANNHILDYGTSGVLDTLQALDEAGIDHVGAGKEIETASKTLYKEIQGQTLAIINCCESEFSIATEEEAGANPLNPIRQFKAIQEARKNADYVVVIVHGGHEMFQLPNPRMKETYRFFVDAGADAVINHHQHCFSGYEIYQGKPIFYGLGNFCFDNPKQRNAIWNKGYMVQLTLNQNIEFEVIPYTQCDEQPAVTSLNESETEEFNAQIHTLNQTIADDHLLKEKWEEWMDQTSGNYTLACTPYDNRYLRAACERGWIPAFLSKRRALNLLNYVECDAHRERLIRMLKMRK